MKVVITGAAGQISYSLVPFLCENGIFNSEKKLDLALVEIPGAMERLGGFVKGAKSRAGSNPILGAIPCGAQFHFGRNPVWAQFRTGRNSVGGIPFGRDPGWAQFLGRNPVGGVLHGRNPNGTAQRVYCN